VQALLVGTPPLGEPNLSHNGGIALFTVLNRQTKITGNQKRIVAAAIIGDMLDFSTTLSWALCWRSSSAHGT
jgi:hypothetical protein